MDEFSNSKIHIFCDGGIGNRINALISGLALANYFSLKITVYWPVNSWCGASFEDIFQNSLHIKTNALNQLAGEFAHAKFLLHDEIGAQFLNVPFASAYDYQALDDFQLRALSSSSDIFFYPAVIPQWIPEELIHKALVQLLFTKQITDPVIDFINNNLKKSFHGLHLRRTDLRVGLSDQEVLAIVQRYPDEVFFVCSDDPQAELLASSHPNVHARTKHHHVEKNKIDSDWISLSLDKEGRQSYGNINRSREAMLNGTIDLLILAHGKIIGYSGSTFQHMARLIGEISPLVTLKRPTALPYFSPSEIKVQIERQLINPGTLFQVCQNMIQVGDIAQALDLMRLGFELLSTSSRLEIAHNLGVLLLNQNQPRQARLYFTYALQIQEFHYSSLLHFAYASTLLSENEEAQQSLFKAVEHRPQVPSPSDSSLESALIKRLS